ncbi:Gfo/Idh/MocA family oxidoreductase [Pseudohoeflea suaedae]|uniref:Gfo/Idh/MocA family oxidoreductase n=1 Tax=Pseudohoeflea suaedae TaxID=877384 RepID=A0A4R5PHN9_9HYPH|nr:Gfo/Idh/MocA family oxidoreductase [Pseudohoeflea suaedae]TDH34430.1 Gfo/Idh/MocA family oxidoreductase [Pseudohoeflea suaedae]
MSRQDGKIRWGIASTGAVAHAFAQDIRSAKGAVLAGVASRDPQKARRFAGKHPGIKAFDSLDAMVASDLIDAVYVASPHSAHLSQALTALEARKPVLVEKPLTTSTRGVKRLSEASFTSRTFAMEAMWTRYLPAVRAARKVIRAGQIGTIRSIRSELTRRRPFDPKNRFFDPAQAGGALLDIGVYQISLACFFLGKPETIEGSWTEAPTGVDVAAELTLGFGTATAHLSCGFDRDGDNRFIIEGDKGTLVLGIPFIGARILGRYNSPAMADLAFPGGEGFAARWRRKIGARLPLPGAKRKIFPVPGTGLSCEIEAASNAIREGRMEEPDNTLSDSLMVIEIVETILAQDPKKSWKPGR